MRQLFGQILRSTQAFGAVLRKPDLRKVELAFLAFNLAELATWVAILVFAYGKGGAGAVGLVAFLQLVPSAIVAPLGAALGDRFRRDRVLPFTYILQSLAMAGTSAALFVEAPIGVVYALAALTATSITLTRPAHRALLPSLAETPEELVAANAASGTLSGISDLAGPAIGGVLLGVAGPDTVFAVMSGALLGAGLLILTINGRARPSGASRTASGLLEGFRVLARDPEPRSVVELLGCQALVWGALDVILVVLALEVLRRGLPSVGYLSAALGAGSLLGASATILLVGRRRLAGPFGAGILLCGLPLAALAIAPRWTTSLALLAIAGVGGSLMDVAGQTLLQRVTPDEVLSRVFGVLEGIYMGSLALGSIAAPAVLAALGVRGAFVLVGFLLPVTALLAWRRLSAIDAAATVPGSELALLRSLDMFAPMSTMALERVASRLQPVELSAGEVVIQQGERGDRFYVIAEGRVAVSEGGRTLREQGPGEYFGEIALLRDVPRTATVTAMTDVVLYALERSFFLDAVTGHPEVDLPVKGST